MKTIKLPYNTNHDLTSLFKQYSNIVRYSYNRFLDNLSEKDIRLLTKSLNNTQDLNSWLIQCSIKDGKAIHTRFQNNKVIFGGKNNFNNRTKNKLSKQQFIINRLCPINIQGEYLKQGNRSFKLDIIDNNQIIFKLSKQQHINLILPKLRNNIKNELFKLQQFNDIKQNQKGYTYSIRLDMKYIYISFEEIKKQPTQLKSQRCLGIDMNPDTIGISILEDNKVIFAKEFSLKLIFNKIFKNKLSSNDNKMKYYHNKLKFETYEISKSITKLAKYYKCETVFIEDLSFKSSSNISISNRKNKNLWKRELFVNNLNKRLNIEGIKLHLVNPAYSSFIGNMMYDYTDAINASIEIARRGYEYRINKNKIRFYPDLIVKHQWKEMATKYTDWKNFYLDVKNSKLKYRVSLDDCSQNFKVFKQNSTNKSMIINYVFYETSN